MDATPLDSTLLSSATFTLFSLSCSFTHLVPCLVFPAHTNSYHFGNSFWNILGSNQLIYNMQLLLNSQLMFCTGFLSSSHSLCVQQLLALRGEKCTHNILPIIEIKEKWFHNARHEIHTRQQTSVRSLC